MAAVTSLLLASGLVFVATCGLDLSPAGFDFASARVQWGGEMMPTTKAWPRQEELTVLLLWEIEGAGRCAHSVFTGMFGTWFHRRYFLQITSKAVNGLAASVYFSRIYEALVKIASAFVSAPEVLGH